MKILDDLTPEQKDAATSEDSVTVISAGAGTGKTRTLTARIAHLISDCGIPASEIVAVTFTRKAAAEIAERVAHSVGPAADGLRVGTFHSIANRLLRRHAPLCGLRDGGFAIADDEDRAELLRKAAEDPHVIGPFEAPEGASEADAKEALKDWSDRVSAFSSRAARQISLWKSWGLTADMASDPKRPSFDEETERLAAAYSAYQYELDSRNMADFGDLILKVTTMFDRLPDIARLEASRIRHVLVDEAQDANQVQIRFVRHLVSVCGQLTVVGDEDQNIYGFQGGYAGAMSDMAGPGARRRSLTLNRRCTNEILLPANTIVDYNDRKEPKRLLSDRSGAPVRSTSHPTDASEATWVAMRIKELVDGGADANSIAVLFRSSFLMRPFEEALARKGVAATVSSGASMMEREEVKDLLAMVRLSVNPRDELAFMRVANKPARGLGASACETIVAISRNGDMELHEACVAVAHGDGPVSLAKPARTGAGKLARALRLLSDDSRWGRPPCDVIATALSEFEYDRHVGKQDDPERRRANIAAISTLSEAFEDTALFLQEMALATDGDAAGTDLSKVRLMTMHASKGLEFDHVFCPGFDFGVTPNQRSVEEAGNGKPGDLWFGPCGGGLEEERRLVHVAFTRARHTLDVTFPWRRGKLTKRGKTPGPSFFFEECGLRYEEMESVSTVDLGKVRAASELEGRSGFDRT